MTLANDTNGNWSTIAAQLQDAQNNARQIAPVASQLEGFDIAAAYEVADLIHQARLGQGAIGAGRKIGFTNAAMWEKYGVHEPIWGHMYQHTVVDLNGAPGQCCVARLTEPKIEPEIALHFHKAPPEDADILALIDCIDWIAPAFEIVQSHYPGWQFKAPDAIADGGLHGMLFVGAHIPIATLGNDTQAQLASCIVTLLCNDTVRETGTGANALGSPLVAMQHLIGVLKQQPVDRPAHRPIQAGEIVTTGTLTAAFPVSAGERWAMKLQGIGLPDIAIEFTDD